MAKLLIVRTRANLRASGSVDETLKRLGLSRSLSFSIHEDSDALRGMLRKVEHMITWGLLTPALEKKLSLLKAGLHPPRGGFERKGIKSPFSRGGVFGDRGDKLGELVERMLP